MAYDPNDPKDKEIVDGLIAEAVETETKALKVKNAELLKEKKELQKNGVDPKALERLEAENEALQEKLSTAEKTAKDATKEATKVRKDLESESAFTRRLLIDNGLNEALTKANVATELLPGARALIAPHVKIVTDGDKRVAKVGDKELGVHVTEWSQSDEGKHYVKAPASTGAGANGGRANGSAKSVTRAVFDSMDQAARSAHAKEGGAITE